MAPLPPVLILLTPEYESWFACVGGADRRAVAKAVAYLEARGLLLGSPHASALAGTDQPLRELRVNQGNSPIRVAYAFDPARRAVLLLGGNKSGGSSRAFYERFVADAEAIWKRHLASLKEEK